jgi:hypothetical protein
MQGGQGSTSSTRSDTLALTLAAARGWSRRAASTASEWPPRRLDELIAATDLADCCHARTPFREAHGTSPRS